MDITHKKRFVVIVAGGSGKRMESEVPKQFLEISGRPVLMRTIEKFYFFEESISIIVVLPADHMGFWNELKEKYSFIIPHKVVAGGLTRYDSVKNGLDHVDESSIVAIHDGVRPLVSKEIIGRCFETAERFGNAVPVVCPNDSVRISTDRGIVAFPRDKVMLVQTPQVFKAGLIKDAYHQDFDKDFTDDASLLEMTGIKIAVVEGDKKNIKITTKLDLMVAESYSDDM
jgi:2-C-methyl-D-erythritol 4-phosphate cytidylyltransferase